MEKKLVERGADITAENQNCQTALKIALNLTEESYRKKAIEYGTFSDCGSNPIAPKDDYNKIVSFLNNIKVKKQDNKKMHGSANSSAP